MKSLNSLQDSKKARRDDLDEEGHYGQQIAATLRRFTPRQKAIAKMKIQQMLFDVEFDGERSTPTPNNYSAPPMNYYYN